LSRTGLARDDADASRQTSAYFPPELRQEQVFLNVLNEKQWTTQVMVLYGQVRPIRLHLIAQLANISVVFRPDVWVAEQSRLRATGIPVLVLTNTANITRTCEQRRLAQDSVECVTERVWNDMRMSGNGQMANVTAGSKLELCDLCTDFLVDGPNLGWTTDKIVSFYRNVTRT
jgi:hypothetical protein